MSIKIVTDSTCDLPRELIHAHHISVIPLHINKGEDSFLDGLEITPEDIFSYVEKGGDICTTAASNPMELSEYFEELSLQYEAVIMITIGSSFSSCYQNAVIAASEFSNVYIVDSKNLSSGQGIIVMEAAKMAEQGVSPEKICMRLENAASRVNASFILDRLDYMRKGGRCSSVAPVGRYGRGVLWKQGRGGRPPSVRHRNRKGNDKGIKEKIPRCKHCSNRLRPGGQRG